MHSVWLFFEAIFLSKLDFSALLLGLAKQSGMSKRAIAERANISRTAFYNLLNGQVGEAKLSTIVSLAQSLDIPPVELLKPYFNSLSNPANSENSSPSAADSGFIADVTYPDNAIVFTEQTFDKVWAVMNSGRTTWKNLYLECQDEPTYLDDIPIGLQAVDTRVAIPQTAPGEKALVSVQLTAPMLPCSAISRWKAVDAEGNLVFPDKFPLYCMVKVVGC